MNRPKVRKVLECASPLALSIRDTLLQERQRAGAVQDADATMQADRRHPDGARGVPIPVVLPFRTATPDWNRGIPARLAPGLCSAASLLMLELVALAQITITQQATLWPPDARQPDTFGDRVAISGDTAVVGRQDCCDGNLEEVAYVFVRNGTTWSQQAVLRASNAEAEDAFGSSVAISGDTIVVGASAEASDATGVNGDQSNNRAYAAGAAYVFVRDGTNWSQQAYLKASNTGAWDVFGRVAISGNTVVIGAVGEDSSARGVNGNQNNNAAPEAGAAYVFVRNGTNWSQQAYLKASNTQADDDFGGAVAVSGDTVVVGAWEEDSSAKGVNGNQNDNAAPNAGAAYVFVRNGTNWTQQAYLKASNTGAYYSGIYWNVWFGVSVGVSGDTIMVGAEGERSASTGVNGDQNDKSLLHAGAAYVFVRNGTNWTQQAYLKASNTAEDDWFGRWGAISGNTIVVGALARADGNVGAAYVFVRDGTNWSQQAYLPGFGVNLALSGDTLLVGSWGDDVVSVFTGLEPPPPPQLAIEHTANNVRLSWPLSASGFVLDETSALESPPAATVWSEIPPPYQSDGTVNFATLPLAAENKFYRLRKP